MDDEKILLALTRIDTHIERLEAKLTEHLDAFHRMMTAAIETIEDHRPSEELTFRRMKEMEQFERDRKGTNRPT